MTFKPVNQKQSFPELEKEIITFWKENKTFLRSLEIRENAEEFNFYD
jgi:isoleucyl-tRNA synthetase